MLLKTYVHIPNWASEYIAVLWLIQIKHIKLQKKKSIFDCIFFSDKYLHDKKVQENNILVNSLVACPIMNI